MKTLCVNIESPPPLRKKLDNKRKMALKGALINYALKRNAGQGSYVKCILPYLSNKTM